MPTQTFEEIPLNQIHAKSNYRKTFNEKSLAELAQSIKANGVIEPIVVRPNKKGYEIVAGERRFRASLLAGVVTIPALIRDADNADVLKIQIIENVQREGVPFMEEADGIRRLRDEGCYDVKEIAQMIGKSDAYVYVALRLVAMPDEAQTIARNGWISKGVAWEIVKLKTPEMQAQAAKDLARTKPGDQVSASRARFYISEQFGEDGRKPRKNGVQKIAGNDYASNWKKYLVRFSYDEFERFKNIVKGRTQTDVLAEAVDLVMRRSENGGVKFRRFLRSMSNLCPA